MTDQNDKNTTTSCIFLVVTTFYNTVFLLYTFQVLKFICFVTHTTCMCKMWVMYHFVERATYYPQVNEEKGINRNSEARRKKDY